ncbi:MAG: type VII secretion target [Chloroflexota bacterium]|nr:type VII secretion target [Chloroflexota bacterium]
MANASATQVFMNLPAVRSMAKNFGNIGNVLNTIAKVLDTLSTLLKTTAFIGLVGGYAVAQVIDQYKPQIKKMANKCQELNRDLMAAAAAYERGDAEGATRFH